MSTIFGLFEKQLRQSGVFERTICNYMSTWNKFEKWVLRSDPDLKDAGESTQKDISDYKQYMVFSGGRTYFVHLRDYATMMLMLRAGLRVHELCELLKSDIIMSTRAGSVCIRGNGDKNRVVPLNSEVRSALQSYFEEREDESSYVFVSQRSRFSVHSIWLRSIRIERG
ncbi:tyrosine-type recombinase/integrase [Paenibacillus pabuli]|uniref:tyrosine-type recombinase/integrase n=1 Tax=Paenibacillus pabuli TaxID=1472 RepID=UPI003CF0FED1